MSRNLSTAEVARIVGMKESRVRELVRSGLCRPARKGRSYAFSFQDLVVLRSARELMERHVPAVRIRRALEALVRDLPAERPLSGLRIYADGRQVAVREGNTAWQPSTGQTLLNFEVDELAQRVEDLRARRESRKAEEDAGGEAQRAFERALELEDRDPAAACEAYGRALELDPDLVDAYVNLGKLAHEAGELREALRLYRLALERSPEDPVIHFNLGLALEDVSGLEQAISHYERALSLDPDFADAHYNLAGLCEQLGRGADALRHYRAYKKLTEG
jgi:tetratricopeptide (TPR) repeat protein